MGNRASSDATWNIRNEYRSGEGESELYLSTTLKEIKKRGELIPVASQPVNLFYHSGSSPDVTGHVTVTASIESIVFRAQLLLVDSPLPSFSCVIDCLVFVADLS
jgi:hypothetical protein